MSQKLPVGGFMWVKNKSKFNENITQASFLTRNY